MEGLTQFAEWSGPAVAVPASLAVVAYLVRVLTHWHLEHARLSIVRLMLTMPSTQAPILSGNLDELLKPLSPPRAQAMDLSRSLPKLPHQPRRGRTR